MGRRGARWRREAAALVYVEDLADPVLRDADSHHLGRVLRLRDGEAVAAADGVGGWRPCAWVGGRLRVEGPVEVGAGGGPGPGVGVGAGQVDVAIGFVPTKGDRPEWTVQKLTELGVDRIVVVVSQRSVVRWDEQRAARHLAKLVEVARQAGMQSRRTRLPVVSGPVSLAELVDDPSTSWSLAVPGGPAPAAPAPGIAGVGVAVGPEGGWSPEEEGCGLPAVGLGPGILRAETAALAAATLVVALRSGLVGPGG